MSELKKRLKFLDNLEGIDSVVIFNSDNNPNFFYFTNSNVIGVFYYDFNKPKIFTNEMEFTRAGKSWVKNVEIIKTGKEITDKITGKIGIDKKNISASVYEKIKARKTDVSEFLGTGRSIKTNYEKKCIKKACSISTKIYGKIENEWKGMKEIELKGLIEFMMHKKGVTPSFPAIVAAGNNVKFPHHVSEMKKIKLPLLIDLGVRYNGYCSDITRTIGSRFDKAVGKVFTGVEEELRPNKKVADLDKKARSILGKYSKYFIHDLGHGIGLEVHEKPVISQKSKDVLKPGMTFTIEPGIYIKGGIRREENYLMTESGAVKLS